MIKRIQIYGLLAIVLGCLFWQQWPKEGQLEPNARIVSYGDGDHGDVTFTNPTILLLSGQNVRFSNLTFANQSNCCWQGAVIMTEIVTNLTCTSITTTNNSGPIVNANTKSTHNVWVILDVMASY